ncbi:hypothetical protein SK128_021936, partial [Halocaridina rubra]
MDLENASEEEDSETAVKYGPVELVIDEEDADHLLDELRPEDQGIRADDPEFNAAYDYEWTKGRVRGRG